jgi:amino acid transporter
MLHGLAVRDHRDGLHYRHCHSRTSGLNNPDYVFQRFHATLLTIAIVAFCVLLNTFGVRRLPLIEGGLAIFHFAGLFAIIIVLWKLGPKNNAHDAFLKPTNNGGWPSEGLSMMVGLYPLTLSLLGFDSQVHMCQWSKASILIGGTALDDPVLTKRIAEEIQGASRALPRPAMWSTYLNASLGFIMIITPMFTWGNLDEIAASVTGYHFIQLFYNTTKSYAATDIITLVIILPLTGSVVSCVATASRQIWAFARDNAVPGSGFVRHVRCSCSQMYY